MLDGFDVVAALDRGLRGRAEAWQFIQDFLTHWGMPAIEEPDGRLLEALASAEERLGVRLPDAVREVYGLLGGRPDLTSNQDRFAEPEQLEFDDGALVYRWENQAVASWGILRSDLDSGQPDPPTRMCFYGETVWHPWMPSFSAACVEMVLWEWMFGRDVAHADNGALGEGGSEPLERLYTRLALPEYPVLDLSRPGARWFAGPGAILREDCREWIWVRARDEEALDVVRQALPVDWLM